MSSGLIALLIAQLAGALGPLFLKFGTSEIPPFTFSALRLIIALAIFTPFYLRKKERLTNKEKKDLVKKSLFFFGNIAFFSIGIQFTTVIMSQILYALLPLIVFLFACFIVKEKITKQKMIGLFFGLFGILFLLEQSIQTTQRLSFGSPLGNVIVLLAVLSWSSYFVFSKQLQTRYEITTITYYNFLTATILFTLLAPFEWLVRPLVLSKISMVSIGSVFGVAIFNSVIMIFLMQYGIKITSAFSASLFQYLGPFFAGVIGITVFHEKLTVSLIIGGILVLTGVFIANFYSQLQSMLQYPHGRGKKV